GIQETFSSSGPRATGVGVGMVPHIPPAQPFTAELNIRDVTLDSAAAVHLWRTILPFNLVDQPGGFATITLKPASAAGSLRATVEVYSIADPTAPLPDELKNPIAKFTNSAGQTAQAVLDQAALAAHNLTLNDLCGRTLLFRVQAVDDTTVGDGIYTLSMNV